MTPTPSLKEELAHTILNKSGTVGDIADQILDLVINKVLDLPEMQKIKLKYNGKVLKEGDIVSLDWRHDDEKMIAIFLQDNGKNNLRTQLTSTIKGLKG